MSYSAEATTALPAAMRAAFEQLYPQIPWDARNSREDWRETSAAFKHTWLAATRVERERCCDFVRGMCSSGDVAQRTVDAIRGVELRARVRNAGPGPALEGIRDVLLAVLGENRSAGLDESDERFWVLELRPAFEPHPAFSPVFYRAPSGIGARQTRETRETRDLGRALRWPSRAAAERAAENMLGTLSCTWEVTEFVVTPAGLVRATGGSAA